MRECSIIGIIPARGGSKRLPKKNIIPLLGKPVITYTIKAAKESGVFNKIIVSTDDNEIADIAKKYGADAPFVRPKELATDTAHTPPVIEHAVRWVEKYKGKVDVVVTLEPSSPLRKARHIKDAVKLFLDSDVNSVISMSDAFPPQWIFRTKDNKLIPAVRDKPGNPFNYESQELTKWYKPNGVIYVTNREFLRKNSSVVDPNSCKIIITDEESSKDLDTKMDVPIIEEILKKRKKEFAKTFAKYGKGM